MEQGAKKFILQVILITSLFLITGYVLFYTLLEPYRFGTFLIIPLFFGAVSSSVHLFLIRRARRRMNRFIPGFLGATGLKLAVYIVFLILMLLFDRPHAVNILISFIAMYLVYTIHEVMAVLAYLKKQ